VANTFSVYGTQLGTILQAQVTVFELSILKRYIKVTGINIRSESETHMTIHKLYIMALVLIFMEKKLGKVNRT
jgi:hypothetical protein